MSRFLRAPVVSEFQARERGPLFWKMYTVFTWGATLIGGVTMFSVDYVGNSRGDHVFKNAQEWTRRTYEDAILNGGVKSRGDDASLQQQLDQSASTTETRRGGKAGGITN
jgi:hypothetical protein